MKSNIFWCRSVAWITTQVLYGTLLFGFVFTSWPVEAADSSDETFNHIQDLYDEGKFSDALPIAQQWTMTNETLYGLENDNASYALVCSAHGCSSTIHVSRFIRIR
jgi:hypothetical protein